MNKLQQLIQELCPNGVEWKTLEDTQKGVAELSRGRVMSKEYLSENSGEYPVYSSQTANNGEIGKIDTFDYDGEYITWTTDGANAGTVFHRIGKFSITNVCGLIRIINTEEIKYKFLFYWLSIEAKKYVYSGMGNPKLMSNQMAKIQIPIPPTPVQTEIVRILDKFSTLTAELQAELQARKSQYEYYRNQLLDYPMEESDQPSLRSSRSATSIKNNDNLSQQTSEQNPPTDNSVSQQRGKVEWKTLGEIGEVRMCKRILKGQTSNAGDVPFYKIGTFGNKPNAYISRELFEEYKSKYSYPKIGEVLISASGTIGRSVIFDGKEAYFQDSNIVWIEHDESQVLNKYLFYVYQIVKWEISEGGTIQRLYNDNLKKTKIPIPYPNDKIKSLTEQARIVSILDKFDALVNSISEGLPKEIELRQKQYEYYRDMLLTFPQK